jgi:hypothetical protein
MSKQFQSAQERIFAERLQRDARDDWPQFNEALHRRIVAVVRQRRAERPLSVPLPVVRRRGWLVAAFAAACLLGAVAVNWRMTQREPGVNVDRQLGGGSVPAAIVPAASIASLPMPSELAGRGMDTFNRVLIAAALPPQSADLKHDTRLAAESLLERLPVGVELLAVP